MLNHWCLHAWYCCLFQSPCTTMLRYTECETPTPEQVAAWFPNDRKWPTEDVYVDGSDNILIVYLMDDCPDEWKYHGNKIRHRIIMDILNSTWKRCFVLGEQAISHIRVTSQGKFSLKLLNVGSYWACYVLARSDAML